MKVKNPRHFFDADRAGIFGFRSAFIGRWQSVWVVSPHKPYGGAMRACGASRDGVIITIRTSNDPVGLR